MPCVYSTAMHALVQVGGLQSGQVRATLLKTPSSLMLGQLVANTQAYSLY